MSLLAVIVDGYCMRGILGLFPTCYCSFENRSDIVLRGRGAADSEWLLSYDQRTRNPRWAVERFTRNSQSFDGSFRKSCRFYPEQSIKNEAFRVRPRDYNDSGYDRGHVVPAADFGATMESTNATFTMANVSPQVPALNKGFWSKFEAWTRQLASKDFDEVFVITGPVFAPTFVNGSWVFLQKAIGPFPRLVSVPTHFFKVILCRKFSDQQVEECYVGAFLVPNSDVDKNAPLIDFLVRLDQLEAIVGFQILGEYSRLSESDRSALDSCVPPERDLARVLDVNAKAMSQPLNWKPKKGANSLSGSGKTRHLCYGYFDCNRPLFAKAS